MNSLSNYTAFGVSASAQALITVKNAAELEHAFNLIAKENSSYFVLGSGSNVLFVDDFPGTVLHIAIPGIDLIEETPEGVTLRVGAGVVWNDLVNYCVDRHWYGIENLALIPGTVGAAPVQNIGAYGAELAEVFQSLEALNVSSGTFQTLDKNACTFSYRNSIFKHQNQYLITSIDLTLSKIPHLNTNYGKINVYLTENGVMNPNLRDVRDAVIAIRRSKLPDPEKLGNAGSFFKNPVVDNNLYEALRGKEPDVPGYPADGAETKIPAAWLIEKCGWKGKRVGNCGVYEKHALILVNYGGATGRDIYNLSKSIQASVMGRFGIGLQPEVHLIKG